MMFVHIKNLTDKGTVSTLLNLGDVRKITYDSLSTTPGIYVTYKNGTVDRFSISSYDEFESFTCEVTTL